MILLLLALGAFAYGGAHQQDWNCLGPQPSLSGSCSTFEASPINERRRVEGLPPLRGHSIDGHPQSVADHVRRAIGER